MPRAPFLRPPAGWVLLLLLGAAASAPDSLRGAPRLYAAAAAPGGTRCAVPQPPAARAAAWGSGPAVSYAAQGDPSMAATRVASAPASWATLYYAAGAAAIFCLAFLAASRSLLLLGARRPLRYSLAAGAGESTGRASASASAATCSAYQPEPAGLPVGRRAAGAAGLLLLGARPAGAAVPLPDCLYTLLRVQEATRQERRLIATGLYRDVQRANVKLAVRMMLENYRLSDTFANAAAYVSDPVRQAQALQAGRGATEALYTVLEYFDPSQVDNLKVGDELYGEKKQVVVQGLEATDKKIEEFLAFLPPTAVQAARAFVAEENELNRREFPADLGGLLNLDPK